MQLSMVYVVLFIPPVFDHIPFPGVLGGLYRTEEIDPSFFVFLSCKMKYKLSVRVASNHTFGWRLGAKSAGKRNAIN